MDVPSFEIEQLERIRALALVVANGGVWTDEEAVEAAKYGEIKKYMAEMDKKTDLAQRLPPQIEAIKRKV